LGEEHTVTVRGIHWQQALRRVVLVAVAIALVPLPVFAGDTTPAPKAKSLQVAVKQMAAREAAKAPVARRPEIHAQQDNTSKKGAGFFRTGPGIAALVVMGVGAGYALYSVTNDRIHSPGAK
jgi:hypothetical protein